MTDFGTRTFIETLLRETAPNASVVGIDERDADYVISLAGTTTVVAHCRIPREALEAAATDGWARERVRRVLKRGADDAVAPLPDARG